MDIPRQQNNDNYRKKLRYVNYLTGLFLLVSGMKGLSGECVTFFSDRLIHDLNFTTSQYSSMTALYYLSFGVSSIVIGALVSRSRRRKVFLVPMTLMVGVFSILASQTSSYWGLAACRFGTGVFTGSSQAMMLNVISKNLVREDYGTRNGIIGGGSTVISGTMGPIILAALATYFAWNSAFLLTGVLLVVMALLILFTVQEVDCETKGSQGRGGVGAYLSSVKELFQNRAFVLCFVIGLLETTGNLCLGVFMPLYFSEVMGFDTATKGVFMSLRGMCYIPVGFLVPLLADKFPVKRVMATTFVGAVIAPAAAFLLTGTMASAYILAIFGAWAGVTVTLFTYMIPRVALPENLYMQASGMILGVAVLFGGSLAPQIMSALIETGWEIEYVLGLCAVLFILCAILSLLVTVERKKPAYSEGT